MKKTLAIVLSIIITIVCTSAFSEELSDNEKDYLGAWLMYADNGEGTLYVMTLVFLDNMEVVQRSMVFENGKLAKDNKATGIWGGFTDKTIVFTLAGTDMTAMIKDNGYLYEYFFKDITLCGIFMNCPDMAPVLGW